MNVRLFTNAHGYLQMRSHTGIKLLSVACWLFTIVQLFTTGCLRIDGLYACIPINEWPDKKFLANHNIDVDTQYNIDMYGFSIIIT